jgi:hypothetical protein
MARSSSFHAYPIASRVKHSTAATSRAISTDLSIGRCEIDDVRFLDQAVFFGLVLDAAAQEF